MNTPLSRRARKLVASPSAIVVAHFKCKSDPFHAQKNPGGYINLGTAENNLVWDLLEPKLNLQLKLREHESHYDFLFGTLEMRAALVRLLGRHAGKYARSLTADQIVASAGASSVIDMLAFSLCEPGDGILIPAPYYSGFDHDLKARTDVLPIPVPLRARDGFELNVEAVAAELASARKKGIRIPALLVCSPNNPLGVVLSDKVIRELIDFTRDEGIYCILDEIYANSVFGAGIRFTSGLSLDSAENLRHLITVYGFAKDFGLSGFKVGVAHSYDPEVIAVMRELSYFSPVSNHTQALLVQALSDSAWVDRLFETNQKRLRGAFTLVSTALQELGVPVHESQAGLFLWADFSKWLKDSSGFEAEKELWQRIFDQARVSISPGANFHSTDPGWFRICFAHDKLVLGEAVKRLGKAL